MIDFFLLTAKARREEERRKREERRERERREALSLASDTTPGHYVSA